MIYNKNRTVYKYLSIGSEDKGIDQWQIQGGAPPDQNFLNFIQFFVKSGTFVRWRPPPEGLAPPPTGNLRSAPVDDQWRIQDFPAGGGALAEGKSLLFGKIFAENCMKMKETTLRGDVPPWIRQNDDE